MRCGDDRHCVESKSTRRLFRKREFVPCCSNPIPGRAGTPVDATIRRVRTYAHSGLFALATLLATFTVSAAAQGDISSLIHGSLSVRSEILDNLSGGIAHGTADNHLLVARLSVDGGAFGLPAGSKLQASFIRTWDGEPSANLVGDAQGLSNIAASPRSSLYTLWYHQPLPGKHWSADLGLIPADEYFDVADSAGLLINSSFGVQPTWSANTIAPIYPTAGVGAFVTWDNGRWRNRTGIFQADPGHRSSALARGFLAIDELNFIASAATMYEVGAWTYRPNDPPSAPLPVTTRGGYASIEHALDAGGKAPTLFARVGWSQPRASAVPFDIQAGVFVPEPFGSRPGDQLSLGIASARLRGQGVETAFEATYLLAVTKYVSLQPDLQYVVNPGGMYPAATVALMRLHVDL